MARTVDLTIDLDSLTAQDWADAIAIARAGGVELADLDLAAAGRNPRRLPLPALAALIHVARRKQTPRATAAGSVNLAADALGVARG